METQIQPAPGTDPALALNNGTQVPTQTNMPETAPDAATQAPEQGTEAATQQKLDVRKYMESLPPQERALLEPVLKQWQADYTKTRQEETAALNQYKEYAQAFDILRNYKPFLQWYARQTNGQPQEEPEIETSQITTPPPPVASEITVDELEQAQIDPKKMQSLIERTARNLAVEESQKVASQHAQLRTELELDAIARDNPDFWDLDKMGLLEPFLYYYVDLNGRPSIEAYMAAKKVMSELTQNAKNQALGIVQNQKKLVSEPPSSMNNTPGVIWAEKGVDPLTLALNEAMQGRQTEVRRKR
jgi:ATP-dependent Clp protease ATP-binding subunit ClpA